MSPLWHLILYNSHFTMIFNMNIQGNATCILYSILQIFKLLSSLLIPSSCLSASSGQAGIEFSGQRIYQDFEECIETSYLPSPPTSTRSPIDITVIPAWPQAQLDMHTLPCSSSSGGSWYSSLPWSGGSVVPAAGVQ